MKSRRRIAFPEASDHASYVITAGICDRRNGFRSSFCVATILRIECPLSAKSGHQKLAWGRNSSDSLAKLTADLRSISVLAVTFSDTELRSNGLCAQPTGRWRESGQGRKN